MGKEDDVSTWFLPTLGTIKQGIKPEVLVNRMDFERFRIILVSGKGRKTNQVPAMLGKARKRSKQLPCLRSERKEQVKIKCLNLWDEGNLEQSLDQWLGKEDEFSCAELRLRTCISEFVSRITWTEVGSGLAHILGLLMGDCPKSSKVGRGKSGGKDMGRWFVSPFE